MSTQLQTSLTTAIGNAARDAGLVVLSNDAGVDFNGQPTAQFQLALTTDATPAHTLKLELSDAFDFHTEGLLPAMTAHLQQSAKRLRNPRPDAYVTLAGIPVSFSDFAWPFHRSTTGADTYIVHGVMHLEDGSSPSVLHAKISASMTVTFAEIVAAPEQPYAESFIYNAIRKTLDQGQLELLKSGNRQPVPVTTRYYSRWQKKFFFADTTDQERESFIACRIYWLSGVLGDREPVWIADPRDAQYLNTTEDVLQSAAARLEAQGLLTLSGDFAAATEKLMERADQFKAQLAAAIAVTKPAFNEDMRAGHTNM
ncbi:MAG TPA: hypothetical protein VGD59_13800 [Acidisarcina sp.]